MLRAKNFYNRISSRKPIAVLLVAVMLIETLIGIPFGWIGFSLHAASSATAQNTVALGDAGLNYATTLVDNGNGIYTLTYEIETTFSHEDVNVDRTVSQNYYFTASHTGTYLIELWGGDGAKGQDTAQNAGGDGGTGGYIYGTIELKKGQTLYYMLGGHGEETLVEDFGGGANGEGGGHGALGSYTVGGGGGYSAVFLFDEGEFDEKYLDDSGNLLVDMIDEEDRVTKYIMIAGGGGGGGAGNASTIIFDATPTGSPHGGAAGSLTSNYGVLSGTGYDVEGVYFVGEDGKSSGTSTAYVGKGGSNVPGAVADTFTTLIDGKQPNDWRGTYNEATSGGYGGSGNLRGGAGGAGFCGGSGGVMTTIISAYNIGGGGGGSSFMANSVTWQNLDSNVLDRVNGDHDGSTGGAIHIAYIPDSTNLEYLENVSFTGQLSPYFTVNAFYMHSDGTTGEIAVSENNEITLSGLSLVPNRDSLVIELDLVPMEGFAGGNNIPLWVAGHELIADAYCTEETHQATLETAASCAAVNVPLNIKTVRAHNYLTNEDSYTFVVSDLFDDIDDSMTHTALRNAIANGTAGMAYDFIESIGAIQVRQEGSTESLDVSSTVTVTADTDYEIFFTVTPKGDEVATVGEPIVAGETEPIIASIIFLMAGEGTLGGRHIGYSKLLTENNGVYTLSLTVKTTETGTAVAMPVPDSIVNTSTATITETVSQRSEHSGYYLIQLWGASGGKGAGTSGGSGASGSTISIIVPIAGEANYSYTIGAGGANGTSGSFIGIYSWNTGGGGGSYTALTDNDGTVLAVAGGGGGGSGAGRSDSGVSATQNTTISGANTITVSSSYNGGTGDNGQGWFGGNAGDNAGTSIGSTYLISDSVLLFSSSLTVNDIMTKFGVTEAVAQQILDNASAASANTNPSTAINSGYGQNGGAWMTCLALDDPGSDPSADLSGYTLTETITRYFDIGTISGVNNNTTDADSVTLTFDTPVISDNTTNQVISITGIDPYVKKEDTEDADGNPVEEGFVDFTISVELTPKEGFLGGNDVPLLNYVSESEPGMIMGQAGVEENMPIEAQNETDYANVAIPDDVVSGLVLEVQNRDYVIGDAPIPLTGADGLVTNSSHTLTVTEDWMDDYVMIVDGAIISPDADAGATSVSPNVTTSYIIATGVKPVADPEKAVIITGVTPVTMEKTAVVTVYAPVIYDNLTNITHNATATDGRYLAETAKDYTVTLTAAEGYALPASVTVTVGGTAVAVTYNSATGVITIPAAKIDGEIVITAEAESMKYTLYYVYPTTMGEVKAEYGSFMAGTVLTVSDVEESLYSPDEKVGYTYAWDWGTDVSSGKFTMPGSDWYIYGDYTAKVFTLTVNYYKENTTDKVAESYIGEVAFDSTYTVTSPAVAGYAAKTAVVTGTVTAEGDITVNVEYTPTAGKIFVHEITTVYDFSDLDNPKIGTVSETKEYSFNTGESYSIPITVKNGYEADVTDAFKGVMPAEGATYTVHYTPKKLKVTLNATGGNVVKSELSVLFGTVYGYDADSGSFGALPTPVKTGYTFKGWYLNGSPITEDTQVTASADHTLTAQWEAQSFKLIIHYVDEDGNTVAASVEKTVQAHASYGSIISPTKKGYTADKITVSGTMPAANTVITVTYYRNHYTFTLILTDKDDSSIQEKQTHTVEYGKDYSFTVPVWEGYSAEADTVTLTNVQGDSTRTVLYTKNTYDITLVLKGQPTDGEAITLGQVTLSDVKYGESYAFTQGTDYEASYTVDGIIYKNSTASVTGVATADRTLELWYYETAPVISVTVSWGDLSFVYSYGEYDPDGHRYPHATVTPETLGSNYIQVSNNEESEVNVIVGYGYNGFAPYSALDAYFTAVDDKNATQVRDNTVSPDSTKTVYVWLEGELTEVYDPGTQFESGQWTVSISKGGR